MHPSWRAPSPRSRRGSCGRTRRRGGCRRSRRGERLPSSGSSSAAPTDAGVREPPPWRVFCGACAICWTRPRRPQRQEVLEEIFLSRRWSSNRRVRRALALNPYSPPALASAALALLTAPDLREVAADLTISSDVRVHARRLLAARGD